MESIVHIEDYSKKNYFEYALIFAAKLIKLWEREIDTLPLEIIISQTEFGYHLSAHSLREEEAPWINIDDIEEFTEAVLIIR